MTTEFKEALKELQLNLNRWIEIADENQLQKDTNLMYKELLAIIDTTLKAPNQPFQVFIKNYNGKTYTLDISSDDSISEIKLKIEDKLGVPASEQRLIVAGKQLNDNKSASDYRLKKESTIHLTLSLQGGDPLYVLCTTLCIAIPTMLWLIVKCGSRQKAKDYLEENASNDEVIDQLRNQNQGDLSSEDETVPEEEKQEKSKIKIEDIGNPMMLAYSPKYFKFENNTAKAKAESILNLFKEEGREFDSIEHIIATVMEHPDIQDALGVDKEIKALKLTIIEDCHKYGSQYDSLNEYHVKNGTWEQIPSSNHKIRPEGDYQLVVTINGSTYKYHVHSPTHPNRAPIPGEVMNVYGASGTQTSMNVINAILRHHPRPACWDEEVMITRKKNN